MEVTARATIELEDFLLPSRGRLQRPSTRWPAQGSEKRQSAPGGCGILPHQLIVQIELPISVSIIYALCYFLSFIWC